MSDLAAFLRTRREQLRPEDVGLQAGSRRRTPGLRREEVATLAGVSVDYLVRLEQGRDSRPSAAVVAALSDALRLSPEERTHLALLTAIEHTRELCPTEVVTGRDVAPTVQAVLDSMVATAAFVVGPFGDVLAANDAWRALVRPLGVLDHDRANLAWFTFLDPRAMQAFPAWAEVADDQARRLRVAHVRWSADPRFVELLDELGAAAAFASRWSSHDVADLGRGHLQVRLPEAGIVHIVSESMLMTDGHDQRLVTWLPADDASARTLHGVLVPVAPPVDGPARLRVVGN